MKYKKRNMKMDFIMGLGDIKTIEDIIKTFYICILTYYTNFKVINKEIKNSWKNNFIVFISMIIIVVICRFIKNILGFSYNIIFMILLINVVFVLLNKQRFAYSLLVTVISLSINYSIFSISVILTFVPIMLLNLYNTSFGLLLISIIYPILIYLFFNIKRFKRGFSFLQKNIGNENIDILILNVSIIILFCITMLSNYNIISSNTFGFSLIIFSIIMFITIQKSLQLYYKQKLQERETNDIKEELKNKDKEIEELEKENLRLNKTNHSIAHKQKSLEYELNQLLLKNEIVEENNIKSKLETISKEIQNENTAIEIDKTNIPEIDNMLKYMQSECIKNKIDFELQINGNIHHMVNQYIQKSDLEILLADHIKNAIIAINHSENINKNILVRLGLIDGFYSVYIYDSGIEFEIKTLINLGIKPSTTHEKDGGTGMGFMNTFDTLRKYKASLVIHEYGKPSKDNFTKLIKVIFDNQNEYKISSYRKEDIQKQDIEKRVSF